MPLSSFDRKPVIRPAVALALPPRFINRKQMSESFAPVGIVPAFAVQPDELINLASNPECFMAVVDLLFAHDSVGVIQHLLKAAKKTVYVVSEELSAPEEAALRKMGVSGFLRRPLHPSALIKQCLTVLQQLAADGKISKKIALPAQLAGPTGTKGVQPATVTSRSTLVTETQNQVADASVLRLKSQYPEIENIRPFLDIYAAKTTAISPSTNSRSTRWPARFTISKSAKAARLQVSEDLELVNAVLGAARTSLFSMRPLPLWPATECPNVVYHLASSDSEYRSARDGIATVVLPQLVLAFEQRRALYLQEAVGSRFAGLERNSRLLINDQVEVASLVVPILNGKQLFASLFVQFDRDHGVDKADLQDCVAYAQASSLGLAELDFIERVYRSDAQR